jgi:predicted phosphodiesterase
MALFNTLKQILTPYANKINLHTEEIEEIQSDVNDVKNDLADVIYNGDIEWVDGYGVLHALGTTPPNEYRSYTEVNVGIFAGGRLTGHTNDADSWGGAFYDINGNYISGFRNPVTGQYSFDIDVEIPSNAITVKISCRTDYKSEFWLSYPFDRYTPNVQVLWSDMGAVKNDIDNLDKRSGTLTPLLRNGSVGNAANANAVTSYYILPIYKKYDRIYVEFIGDFSLANQYGLAYCLFRGASDGDTTSAAFSDSSVTKKQVNSNFDIAPLYPSPRIPIEMTDISDYDHISVCMFRKLNGTFVPIRIATAQYSLKISYEYNPDIPVRDIDIDDVSHISDNARHIKGNSGTPLTLLHFSDIHADTSALSRIMKDAESYTLDGKICTGDMVGNNSEQITSWWDASVMTCIGNHDSASYDSSTGYNWTALSMANRDAYYITPFKANWGVTHTTGKSYYYKDYTTQKVRLIVMDGMLYNDNGADATAQTAWLADLLASAITNNLHVLIAIHAPHGGAVPVECSFSRYGQDTMPTYSDCNTPQVVIDTVATAIGNGLHFIGYLVGHTHQDNIWDAENDKKQFMYCVTCANVSNVNQWKNSDQNRSVTEDAYNIVTIDTTNTLVKIVRGGGADIDDHMRTREAICIDYSTGDVVGEVL